MHKVRLRDFIGCWLLVGCLVWEFGCSATSGSRFRPAVGSRSVASVGDQALPPSVGSAGSQVAVDSPEPEPYRNPKSRISGRVVDRQGRPVAGATVRLADGTSKSGQNIQATTDPSGGFTLSGLRPGSGFVLIAEANFGADLGTMTGRAQADTAATNVQIRLGDAADDGIPAPVRRGKRGSAQTQPISERVDGEFKPASVLGVVNSEDLAPPADPADEVEAPQPIRQRSKRTGSPKLDPASGWHKRGSAPDPEDDEADQPTPSPTSEAAGAGDLDLGAGSRRRPTSAAVADDVDPLPPALPSRVRREDVAEDLAPRPLTRTGRKPLARIVPRTDPPAEEDETLADRPALGQDSATADLASEVGESAAADPSGLKPMPALASLGDSPPSTGGDVPQRIDLGDGPDPRDLSPPPVVIPVQPSFASSTNPAMPSPGDSIPAAVVPPAPQPGTTADPSADYNPFALLAAAPPEPAGSGDSASVPEAAQPEPVIPAPSEQPATDHVPPAAAQVAVDPAPQRRKWGDLAEEPAPGAAGAAVGVATAKPVRVTSVAAPSSNRPNALLARRSRPAMSARTDVAPASQFDTKVNRLVDFQLPDLDGQAVRFRDLDADFVVLDFWGTWCKECVDSIPALVALQKKYGPNKLKVVGIACEKTAVDRRKALVATAAAQLGINYSVLVASMDGTDPVQRDFQVRFYPTLVLLDRSGKVLFRGEGGTESNLFRLERALTSAQRSTQSARR